MHAEMGFINERLASSFEQVYKEAKKRKRSKEN
jgi:hypothetical protein